MPRSTRKSDVIDDVFSSLDASQVDQLAGAHREAWYAWRRGDTAKAAAILATYEDLPPISRRISRGVEVAVDEPSEHA